MNPTFPYTPLSECSDEIRLITLLPPLRGEDVDECDAEPRIACHLSHFSLSGLSSAYEMWLDRYGCDPKFRSAQWTGYVAGYVERNVRDMPDDERQARTKAACNRFRWGDYWALSYVWGDQTKTRTILVNGISFNVTENLYLALSRLIREPRHVIDGDKIWIDAICINQSDIKEREMEVKKMGTIYSQARGVEIWLGQPSMPTMEQCLVECLAFEDRYGEAGLTALLDDEPDVAGDIIHTVIRLSFEPYWRRVWVIQELALASSESIFYYGNAQFSLLQMYTLMKYAGENGNWEAHYASDNSRDVSYTADALSCLGRCGGLLIQAIRPLDNTANPSPEDNYNPFNYIKALSFIPGAKATDPRDKAYGIRALLPDTLSSRIVPDYAVSKEAAWAMFTKAIIEETGSLSILGSTKRDMSPGLPSWVLSLNATREGLFSACNTSGNIKPSFRFSDDSKVLHCQGFRVDTVAATGARSFVDENLNSGEIVKINFSEFLEAKPSNESGPINDGLRLSVLRTLMGDPCIASYDEVNLLDVPMLDLTSVMGQLNPSLLIGIDADGNKLKPEGEDQELKQAKERVASAANAIGQGGDGDSNSEDSTKQTGQGTETGLPRETAQEWVEFAIKQWRPIAQLLLWRRANAGFKIFGHNLADFFPLTPMKPPSDIARYKGLLAQAGLVCGSRVLLTTVGGRVGVSTSLAQPGDEIYVVIGCNWPLIMRPMGKALEIVGCCFVDGFMLGETVENIQDSGLENVEWIEIV